MKLIEGYNYDQDKLSTDWCRKVSNNILYHGGCVNLLQNKNQQEINEYASGNISMLPYMRMFKSTERKLKAATGDSDEARKKMESLTNAFIPLSLISVKLNSAVHLIYKVLFDIEVQALDSLADKKRKADISLLKNRQKIEAILQDAADQLSQGKIEVGGTKHSATEYKHVPFDLDLEDPLEFKIFSNIVYKLQPEAAYETILQLIYEIKKINGVDLLGIIDTFKFGVQCAEVFSNSITGLPEVSYVHPGTVYSPKSMYPDFRDTPKRYMDWNPTVSDLYNRFSNEIGSKSDMKEIVDGYTTDFKLNSIPESNWGSTNIHVVRIFVICIDKINYVENKNGSKRFLSDMAAEEMEKNSPGSCKELWGQNTYTWYWIPKTNNFFGKECLGWAYRKQGQEAFVTMPLDIYKSQEKSAVEHCIGENKKAIIADIKLMHTIILSAPPGKYIDTKYIRRATQGLLFEGKTQAEVEQDLVDMAIENNLMIGDSEDMDGANEGQFKPFQEIPGGLRSEINGYITVMQQAAANISRYTGINDELSGLNNNPDLLNGARKMNITYGMNAINYAYEARLTQYRNIFEIIAWYVKNAIDTGGPVKEMIQGMIGCDKTQSLTDIGSLKEHLFYVRINLGMRQDEQQELNQSIMMMEQHGMINRLQRYIINQTKNIKEANLLLAAVEQKWQKKQDAASAQQQDVLKQIQDLKTQGLIEVEKAKSEGKDQNIYTTGNVSAKLMQLGHQLGLTQTQMDAAMKSKLQGERLNAGFVKQDLHNQATKENLQQQAVRPLV